MRYTVLLVRIMLLLSLSIHSVNANAQSKKKEGPKEVLDQFFADYYHDDYDAMHKKFHWILRLALPQSAIEEMFRSRKLMFGQPLITELVERSPSSFMAKIRFSGDSTETMDMGFSFTKKNKIIGIYSRADRLEFAKTPAKQPLEKRVAAVDSLFQVKKNNTAFSGCVMVMENGEVVYSNCAGEADRSVHALINDTTVMELASCSKQFTAVGILLLVQEGKIQLTDPITKYIPKLPYKNVTVDHLLHHTGGLADYMQVMDKYWDKKRIATNADMVKLFAEKKPKVLFKPGEQYDYSNTGYGLLATIIERASGLTYHDYMQQRIFTPLGMKHSRIYSTRRAGEKLSNYALGYVFDAETKAYVLPDSLPDQSLVYWLDGIVGDGTVNTCIRDLAFWENAMRKHTLLNETYTQYAFTQGTLNSGKKITYGCGWEIESDGKFQNIAFHTGSWPGYLTMIVHFLDTDRSVVILSNNEYYFVPRMAYRMSQLMCR